MGIRKLNSELQSLAIAELNENISRIEEDLEHIRNWLKQQPHLTPRSDDQFLISVLRGCKWSLQKAKEKIDSFYTVRTLLPEFFANRDPFLPEIQKVLKAGIIYALPNKIALDGPTILFLNLSNAHPEETPYVTVFKVFFMVVDILLEEDDNFILVGFEMIGNYEKTPLSYYLQMTPDILKKITLCITKAYPLRGRKFVGLNVPSVFETLMNTIVKPCLKQKLKERIYLYNSVNTSKCYEAMQKSLFPNEFGGENGSMPEAANKWKAKVESYREWFVEDAKYCSNEKLRVGSSKTYNESFGMEGTFRKLNID